MYLRKKKGDCCGSPFLLRIRDFMLIHEKYLSTTTVLKLVK